MQDKIVTTWHGFTYTISILCGRPVTIMRSRVHGKPSDTLSFDELPFLLQQRVELHLRGELNINEE